MALCREPTTPAGDRVRAMRSAVDTCLAATRLEDVPRFVRSLAAQWLRAASGLSEEQRALQASLAADLPDPRLGDLQAALRADRSSFASGPPLRLKLDEAQPDAPARWEGPKPSDLMARHAAAAAPVTQAASPQAGSIKLLLLMQRDASGVVRCTVVNGTGQSLSKETRKTLTEALTRQDRALQASEVEFVETSVNVARSAAPATLYSVLLRNLAAHSPVPEGDRLRAALRTLDDYLAKLDENALRDLMACEAAWLRSMVGQQSEADAQNLQAALPAGSRAMARAQPEQLEALADQAKAGDEEALSELLKLTLVTDAASSRAATQALLDAYADPDIDEATRASMRLHCLQLFETASANDERLRSSTRGTGQPRSISMRHIPTAVLYLAGQRAMGAGVPTDPTAAQVHRINAAIASRRREAAVEDDRQLVDPGRCVSHREMIPAGQSLQEFTWFTPTYPVVPAALGEIATKLTELAIDSKPLAMLLNVGTPGAEHWITLVAHKPAAGATDFLLFDSDGRTGPAAQRQGMASLLGWLETRKGVGQVHRVSASLQAYSPNSCGAHGLKALRELDDLMRGWDYEPPLLAQLHKELRDSVASWTVLSPEAQRAFIVRERLGLLEPLYPRA